MYVNLTALFHEMTETLFTRVVFNLDPNDIDAVQSEEVTHLCMMCEADKMLMAMPPIIVEIIGDEPYVKHSIIDLP